MLPKMYKRGMRIDSMAALVDALRDGLYVYIVYRSGRGRPTHREFLKGWTYRTVCNYVRWGRIFKAVKNRPKL